MRYTYTFCDSIFLLPLVVTHVKRRLHCWHSRVVCPLCCLSIFLPMPYVRFVPPCHHSWGHSDILLFVHSVASQNLTCPPSILKLAFVSDPSLIRSSNPLTAVLLNASTTPRSRHNQVSIQNLSTHMKGSRHTRASPTSAFAASAPNVPPKPHMKERRT